MITIETKAVFEYPIIMKSKNILCLVLFVTLIVVLSAIFVSSKLMWKSDQILKQVPFGDTTKATYSSKEPITMENSFETDFPSWIKTKTEDMSAKDVFEYFEWSNHSSCQLMNDFGGRFMDGTSKGHRFYDGQKAICLMPHSVAPDPSSCLVYSFGIDNDWSFDETMEKYGCEVYSFDPSIEDAQETFDHSPKIHFYKIGLGPKNMTNNKGWKILNLESIRNMLGHNNRIIDYLKIDIETAEWNVLPEIMKTGQLDSVKQMGLEIHNQRHDREPDLNELKEYVQILRTLERDFGMVRFDSKMNAINMIHPISYMNNQLRSLGYEIAWYNKKFL